MEWYNHYEGQVYVAFSGGKDSTVLLDLARRVYPDIPAVFCDTGLEFPENRDFVKTFDNVVWLRPEKQNFKTKKYEPFPFTKVLEKFGYPIISKKIAGYVSTAQKNPNSKRSKCLTGEIETHVYGIENGKYAYLIDAPFKISDYCCYVMKKAPSKRYQEATGRMPIIATMACESIERKSHWLKEGCNSFGAKHATSKPMSFWTEQDVLEYLRSTGIPYSPLYGDIVEEDGVLKTTGAQRSGCMFCMFGIHLEPEPNRFQRMAITHPRQYDYCINKLGCGEVLDFIGVPYEPLPDINEPLPEGRPDPERNIDRMRPHRASFVYELNEQRKRIEFLESITCPNGHDWNTSEDETRTCTRCGKTLKPNESEEDLNAY